MIIFSNMIFGQITLFQVLTVNQYFAKKKTVGEMNVRINADLVGKASFPSNGV
jgi:hypothetical protein